MKFPLGMAYLQSSGAMLVSGRVNPSKIEWDLTNGPLSCDRAIRYSGFCRGPFRNGPGMEISWIICLLIP